MTNADGAASESGQQSGICLTFDDWFLRGWYGARDLFKAYDAKATFFVGKPDAIKDKGWAKLRDLQQDGHEIGCHSMTHARLTKFLSGHSFQDYITKEIEPALKIMRENGMKVTSFAYPYFKYRPQLTGLLLDHFTMVREAGEQANPVHAIYPDKGNVNVNVMGYLDRTGADLPIAYYEERFSLLARYGGFGVFCGHALGPDQPKYQRMTCSYEDLEEVLALARAHDLAMRPMRTIGFPKWGFRRSAA